MINTGHFVLRSMLERKTAMTFDYCPKCGNKLDDMRCGDDDCRVCPFCNKVYGSSPFPVVEVLVVNEFHEVLLLKQNYISTSKWTVVSG